MPKLAIYEYGDTGSTPRGSVEIPQEPPHAIQELDVFAASKQSAAFGPETCLVKLLSDVDCVIDVGSDPDATGSLRTLNAGKEKIISVAKGSSMKVAVVSSAAISGMDSLEALLKLIASPADAQKQFTAMQDQITKFTAAAADLKAAGDEHRAIEANLAQATEGALNAKAAADKATADLAQREAAFDKDAQDHADKVKADAAAAAERSKALDARETDLAANLATLNKKGADLADIAASLDAKDKELTAQAATVAASQADYEARLSRLKELTG